MSNDNKEYEDAIEELTKQGYSEIVIENWLNPKNLGIVNGKLCDGYSGVTKNASVSYFSG